MTPPLLAGTRIPAGLSYATVLPDFDFETYSEAGFVWHAELGKWRAPEGAQEKDKGLPAVGLDVYASHPTTEVIRLAYDLKDGRGARHWLPGMPAPADLHAHLAAGGLIEAWNTQFELAIWNIVCTRRYGWPPLDPLQLRCAMAKARAHCLAGKLDVTGEVLRIAHPKMKEGDALIKKLTVPVNPTKARPSTRIMRADDPAAFAQFDAYNDRDILSEAECSVQTPDLSADELRHWQNDQAINRRGMAVDLTSVDASIQIVKQCLAEFGQEMQDLTGGIQPSEIQQIRGWLAGRGVHTEGLDADIVKQLLRDLPAGSVERRVVELRSLAGSASVKKVFAIRNQVGADGRLRYLYSYHGARTGRPTGNGPQPMNLPKAGPNVYRCGWLTGKQQTPSGGCGRYFGEALMRCPWCGQIRGPQKPLEWNPGAMEDALLVIGGGDSGLLRSYFGDAMLTVAGSLRGMIVAGPGLELVSSDFTAIEGVVIACLAGEKWRVDAYRNDEPMYLLSAERSYGVPVAEMLAYAKQHGHHHPLRQKGKIGELALGFGGWIGALRAMGGDGEDGELKDQVLKWRAASPAIVHFWGGQSQGEWEGRRPYLFGLEGGIVHAIRNPGQRAYVRRLDGEQTGISYLVKGDVLYCMTPGDGLITYHRPRLAPSRRPYAAPWELEITYEGWNSNQKKGPPGWMRMSLYGGLAAENVTQYVARNIQMRAIDNCERNAHPIVMHTYDEDVAEVPQGTGDVKRLEALMCDVPEWARDWPIKAAGGWCGKRYRKE